MIQLSTKVKVIILYRIQFIRFNRNNKGQRKEQRDEGWLLLLQHGGERTGGRERQWIHLTDVEQRKEHTLLFSGGRAVMWLRNPFPKLDLGSGEDLLNTGFFLVASNGRTQSVGGALEGSPAARAQVSNGGWARAGLAALGQRVLRRCSFFFLFFW